MSYEFDLQLHGVYDKGIPNRERICMLATADFSTKYHSVLFGLSKGRNLAAPLNDNLYWLGDINLKKGDWVFLYTGNGNRQISEIPNGKNRLITLFWGRSKTIFHDPNIVPILVKFQDVSIEHYQHIEEVAPAHEAQHQIDA